MLLSIFQNEHVINALGLVLAGIITYAFALFRAWLTTKIKNEKLRTAVEKATKVAEASMLLIQQTFVDQLKKDGKFSKEKQLIALEKAKLQARKLITDETKKIIEENYGPFEDWLEVQIEALIKSTKTWLG